METKPASPKGRPTLRPIIGRPSTSSCSAQCHVMKLEEMVGQSWTLQGLFDGETGRLLTASSGLAAAVLTEVGGQVGTETPCICKPKQL